VIVHVCTGPTTMGSAIYGQQGELGQLFSKETQAIFFNWKVRRQWASHDSFLGQPQWG
jgi:hypothetical protein